MIIIAPPHVVSMLATQYDSLLLPESEHCAAHSSFSFMHLYAYRSLPMPAGFDVYLASEQIERKLDPN